MKIIPYHDEAGVPVFWAWFNVQKDRRAKVRIQMSIDRLASGNAGVGRNLRGGISELKIDEGPGYRVYFGRVGDSVVILLLGGIKDNQTDDINTASSYWEHWKQMNRRKK